MKLGDYKRIDGVMLLKSKKSLLEQRKKFEEELTAITEITAVSADFISSSGNISDPVGKTAIRRERILNAIEDIDICLNAIDYGLEHIDQDERELLDAFFFSDYPRWAVVDVFIEKYNCSSKKVYQLRRDALIHFSEVIEKHYF